MDINFKESHEEGPVSIIENIYKYPSCETPKFLISISESSNSTRFDSFSSKKKKRVKFNQNVTVVNIQSHKKDIRKQNYQKYTSVFEEDFNDEKNKNCLNCILF